MAPRRHHLTSESSDHLERRSDRLVPIAGVAGFAERLSERHGRPPDQLGSVAFRRSIYFVRCIVRRDQLLIPGEFSSIPFSVASSRSLGSSAKMVLLMVGEACERLPRFADLAAGTGLSRSTVRRACRQLESAGFLNVHKIPVVNMVN